MNPQAYIKTAATTKMSSTDAAQTITITTSDSSSKLAEPAEEAKPEETSQTNNKPIKKVKSKKDLKNDPSRFELPGVNFNAKLIGIDDVSNPRGDKMCQESMYRLKVAVRQAGQHKQKIIINVSLDGIRIIDIRTQATNHTHAVHRISFISRDITDSRAFGYVYGAGEGKHKFYAIKTEKAAEALVLTLRDLFQAVFEMKKQEVEEAKQKVVLEDSSATTESSTDAEEPVYQVPKNGQPVENGTENTYEVPPNNKPVQDEAPDLLNLENELESMERRIEQIDTMEELFKELEAPPTSSQTTPPTAGTGSSFAGDLAGMSNPQPSFSLGGTTFPGAQPFGAAPNPQAGFPAPGGFPAQSAPGFPAQTAPGFAAQQPGAFGQSSPAFGAPAAGQQGFGAAFPPQPTANPFQGAPPGIPPRTGMGFPGQPAAVFPGAPQPAAPFPGAQQPAFPGMPAQQPAAPPSNDPFGNDPFAADTGAFGGDALLTPAKKEDPFEEIPTGKQEKKDVFGDLVNIGSSVVTSKTPKELFTDLATPEKKSLNTLKVEGVPPAKPASPLGLQASDGSSPVSFDNAQSASHVDAFGASSMQFGTSDPFADDPFASTAPPVVAPPPSTAPQPSKPLVQDAMFPTANVGEPDDDIYNIPLPQGPPPPLPQDIASTAPINTTPLGGPPPPAPPRPSVYTQPLTLTQPLTPPLPRIPPRPKSAGSDSNKSSTASISSIPETAAVAQPPVPPRPRSDISIKPVPRPRPRASASLNVKATTGLPSNKHTTDSDNDQNKNRVLKHNGNNTVISTATEQSSVLGGAQSDRSGSGASRISGQAQGSSSSKIESQKSEISNSSRSGQQRSSSVVADPFVATDPFASDDPFTQADPFANDPFAPDPFCESAPSDTHAVKSGDDPFTTIVSSPRASQDQDPFSAFDSKFLNESFKFEKSSSGSSRKSKVKVAAYKGIRRQANDPFGMSPAFK